jgi:hypothetical protein
MWARTDDGHRHRHQTTRITLLLPFPFTPRQHQLIYVFRRRPLPIRSTKSAATKSKLTAAKRQCSAVGR